MIANRRLVVLLSPCLVLDPTLKNQSFKGLAIDGFIKSFLDELLASTPLLIVQNIQGTKFMQFS